MAIFILTGIIQAAVFCGTVLWVFYRDPERDSPDTPGLVLSPADGTVIYIRKLKEGKLLSSDKNGTKIILNEVQGTRFAEEALWQVGISMVFTDVHVNRAPISGTITLAQHTPGKFLSLRRQEALNLNERQTIIFQNNEQGIGVIIVQIASRLVRQIVSYVKEGQVVDRGQRVGMIRFGSQVDLFIPIRNASQIEVEVGQRLTAGITIVAHH